MTPSTSTVIPHPAASRGGNGVTPLPPRSAGHRADIVVLILIALAAIVLHVGGLGFYADDWVIAGGGTTTEDRSLLGIMRATGTPDTPMRPVNLVVLSLVFWLFPDGALAFHVVNAGYIAAMGAGFFLLLRELRLPRTLSFATAACFIVMPHYSATRFWIVAHPINLSMALYFFGTLAALRAVESRSRPAVAAWSALAALGIAGSLLAYEQLLPLAAATPLLVWWHGRRLHAGEAARPAHRRLPIILAAAAAVLAPIVAFKMRHTARINTVSLSDQIEWATWYLRLALRDAYGTFGLELPRVAWRSLRDQWDPAALLLAAAAALLAGIHLRRIATRAPGELPSAGLAASLIGGGAAVFIAGFGLVLVTTMPVTSPTGINSRLAVVAAAGVAVSVVALIGWICGRLPDPQRRATALAAVTALLIGTNVLVVSTLGSFWTDAAREQSRILDDIRTRFPDGPPGRTFLLDGTCPYVGPATVFNSSWDLQQALAWTYRADDRQADVVTVDTDIEADGIHISMFDGFIRHVYAYGDGLYIYRPQEGLLRALPDRGAALDYFNGPGRDFKTRCPPGKAGHGASVLGIPIERE